MSNANDESKKIIRLKRVEDLIKQGKENGFVTQEDILEIFVTPEKFLDELDDLYDTLMRAGIDVFENVSDEKSKEEETTTDLEKELEVITALDAKAITDPVRMYLKEIGRIPLLKRDEEISLAQKVEHLQHKQYVVNIYNRLKASQTEEPSLEEIAEVLEKYKEIKLSSDQVQGLIKEVNRVGDKLEVSKFDPDFRAKEKLTSSNLRLVVSIAKKYIGRGMTFLDLIQEGNKGLIRAVEKYDWVKGFKFSTYATWWIRQAITRAIADQARTIRIPVHMVETINKLIRISRKLMQDLGREPTPEEIGKEMEISPERVIEIMKISQKTTSLETPIGDDDDSYLGDFIPDETQVSPYDATSKRLLKENIDEVLQALSDREARVLKMRFGLSSQRPMTLEEVGQKFGVTRERIRQIEAKALRKLKHPSRRKKLQDYLE